MKKQPEQYFLNVFYSAAKHPGFSLDSTIRGLVGRPEEGKGTDLMNMIRDISFKFKEENAAKRALSRLKKAQITAELVVR